MNEVEQLFLGPDDSVTEDLMKKVADDVTAAILRSLKIAPPPYLPILASATAAAIGCLAYELDKLSGNESRNGPTKSNILLAGLLGARLGRSTDGTGEAYRDFEILKDAGRTGDE